MQHLNLDILRTLHREHQSTLALLERLEDLLGRYREGRPPPADDAAAAALLRELMANLDDETNRHFQFEEEHLFPRFTELAEPGIPMMLKGEHEAIRPLAGRLGELVREASPGGFQGEAWGEFRRLGLELVERLVFHIQKEEMGFLPGLDQMLDPSEDGTLATAYLEIKGGS